MVPVEEIADPKNDYNLNLPRYIDSTEPEDIHDIDAHLSGGIPNRDIDGDAKASPPVEGLKSYWCVFPKLRKALFKGNDHKGYSELAVAAAEIKPTILGHAEFDSFKAAVTDIFAKWQTKNTSRLKGFDKDGHPKDLIAKLAEDLLEAFRLPRCSMPMMFISI